MQCIHPRFWGSYWLLSFHRHFSSAQDCLFPFLLRVNSSLPSYLSELSHSPPFSDLYHLFSAIDISCISRPASGVLSNIEKNEYRPNIDHTALYQPNIDHKSSLKSAYLHISRQKCKCLLGQDYILLPRRYM